MYSPGKEKEKEKEKGIPIRAGNSLQPEIVINREHYVQYFGDELGSAKTEAEKYEMSDYQKELHREGLDRLNKIRHSVRSMPQAGFFNDCDDVEKEIDRLISLVEVEEEATTSMAFVSDVIFDMYAIKTFFNETCSKKTLLINRLSWCIAHIDKLSAFRDEFENFIAFVRYIYPKIPQWNVGTFKEFIDLQFASR